MNDAGSFILAASMFSIVVAYVPTVIRAIRHRRSRRNATP